MSSIKRCPKLPSALISLISFQMFGTLRDIMIFSDELRNGLLAQFPGHLHEMFRLTKRLQSLYKKAPLVKSFTASTDQFPRNPSDSDQFSDLWPLRDLMILIAQAHGKAAGAISRNSDAQTCSRSEKLAACL